VKLTDDTDNATAIVMRTIDIIFVVYIVSLTNILLYHLNYLLNILLLLVQVMLLNKICGIRSLYFAS
jgi:predicted tellurium resistance membrane protein TerC